MHKLHFKAHEVAQLMAHTDKHPKMTPYYEDMLGPEHYDPRPRLYLVRDAGIYLMSGSTSTLRRPGAPKGHSRVVYAEGFDPHVDEGWWDQAQALKTRGDFSLRIPLVEIPIKLWTPDFLNVPGYLRIQWPEGQDCMIFGPDQWWASLVERTTSPTSLECPTKYTIS
jgi:hypothetical protein